MEWYKSQPWLEYSVERDAAFCYPCRVFKCGSNRSEDENWISQLEACNG